MTFGTIIVGLAERQGDDDALALAHRLAGAGADLVPVHVEARHRWGGSPVEGLRKAVERHAAGLLVLGSGRSAPPGRLAPTRTTMQLIQHAACAVAVSPRGYGASGPFRHLGVAYDGTPAADAAAQAAYALAARDHAAVTLYWTIPDGRMAFAGVPAPTVDDFTQQERRRAQDALDAAADRAPHGVNPETVLLRGDPAADISNAASGVVDLLVTGSRGLGPLQRIVAPSVAAQLTLGAAEPVLIVPRAIPG